VDIVTHGSRTPGPITELVWFDMTAQAAYHVTAGNKYTFYVTGTRYFGGDTAIISLGYIHLISAFMAT
jgi:hypothetical protein